MRPSRVSGRRILEQLKRAARVGDRTALTLALDQMRTLAYSPRYWEKYLQLLTHPLPRLVDLLVVKQGEKIARQKGWVGSKRQRPKAARPAPGRARKRPARRPPAAVQPSLFPELS